MSELTLVEVGETIDSRQIRLAFGQPVNIQAACGDTVRGLWHCVTHAETFKSNVQKDTHISDRADHRLAWVCMIHGLERP